MVTFPANSINVLGAWGTLKITTTSPGLAYFGTAMMYHEEYLPASTHEWDACLRELATDL